MIRDIEAADLPALLVLNNSEAAAVNELTLEELSAQVAAAVSARMMADGSGFLVAFGAETPIQGPNHAWFVTRGGDFAYVDRIVVTPAARGKGVARSLYEDLAARGLPLACEVNVEPPNPQGQAFHAKLGFLPVGEATDPRNGKRVRYLMRG
ncbi:GNAT family N-acetyltransferase [Roseococcus pinisoli]|uniref:GNAT family N-acetyltransferase n=1 Tax=Roseococcus pinisoli TaxID=2835040 RepID=A0ABS5Q8J8_9PROT|nr:GNAT family N-acetyltransferase [Roseococcus pinisoli]MBS7810021.1 GNAT family N-acetyltransferase [Roseococcus pinisoli]